MIVIICCNCIQHHCVYSNLVFYIFTYLNYLSCFLTNPVRLTVKRCEPNVAVIKIIIIIIINTESHIVLREANYSKRNVTLMTLLFFISGSIK